jgi:hypothetical protein
MKVQGNTILNVVFAGVVLAIVELITVVLACAYVAQISRRRKREQMFTRFFITSSFYKLRITWIGKHKETKQIRKYCTILCSSFTVAFSM